MSSRKSLTHFVSFRRNKQRSQEPILDDQEQILDDEDDNASMSSWSLGSKTDDDVSVEAVIEDIKAPKKTSKKTSRKTPKKKKVIKVIGIDSDDLRRNKDRGATFKDSYTRLSSGSRGRHSSQNSEKCSNSNDERRPNTIAQRLSDIANIGSKRNSTADNFVMDVTSIEDSASKHSSVSMCHVHEAREDPVRWKLIAIVAVAAFLAIVGAAILSLGSVGFLSIGLYDRDIEARSFENFDIDRSSHFSKEEIYEMLLPISPSIAENGSPQHDALDWLVIQDLALSKERIVQRYILATLYFSTDGEAWANHETSQKHFWLSEANECFWIGVSCKNVFSGNELYNPVTGLGLMKVGLQGTLPAEIGELANLEVVDLSHNKLKGRIPNGLGNLKYLNHVDLSHNSLSGEIPGEFSNLERLVTLILDKNDINGEIPSAMGYMTSLKVLSLANNELFGSLDSNMGNLVKLVLLNLAGNAFEGTIPSSLGQLTFLREFNVSKNKFEGRIPSSFQNLKNLKNLHVDNNKLSDSIPEWIESLTELEKVEMQNNDMTGVVSEVICELENLDVLSSDCGGDSPKVSCTCCTECFPEESES